MMAMGFDGFHEMHASSLKREEMYDYKASFILNFFQITLPWNEKLNYRCSM